LCSAEFHEPEDRAFGIRLQNGSWTGVIGMMQEGAVVVCTPNIIMTADRMDAVDFTTPLVNTRYATQKHNRVHLVY